MNIPSFLSETGPPGRENLNRLARDVFTPPLGEARSGDGGDGETFLGVVGGVVEEREACARAVLEVDDVERSGALVEVVAITARIESEQRAEEKPDRRLVRDDHDVFAGMRADELDEGGQRARGDGEAAFTALRREGVGVLVPFERFLRILGFNLLAGHLFPVTVGNFAQTVTGLDFKPVRMREQTCRLHRAAHGGGVDGGQFFPREAGGQASRLLASHIGELDIGLAGKAVFISQDGRAMANEKNAGVGLGHEENATLTLARGKGTSFAGPGLHPANSMILLLSISIPTVAAVIARLISVVAVAVLIISTMVAPLVAIAVIASRRGLGCSRWE